MRHCKEYHLYMKGFAGAFLAFILSISGNARAEFSANNSATRESSKVIETVGEASRKLREEALNPYASIYGIHRHARDLADGVASQDTLSDFQPYQLKVD